MQTYLYYSGEHPTLPEAEARSAFDAQGIAARWQQPQPRFGLAETEAPAPAVDAAATRLALTHEWGHVLGFVPYAVDDVAAVLARLDSDTSSFACRATRVQAGGPWSTALTERIVGDAIDRPVDLVSPHTTVRAMMAQDGLWLALRRGLRDPKELASRHVKSRPFSSPVSLEPKWARMMLNLAGLAPGQTVVDPMCGTGGIVLEAAALGMVALGSDRDPTMVAGTQSNLDHLGLRAAALVSCDVGQAPRRFLDLGYDGVSAVVSDLPYGRSASTGKEHRDELYRRCSTAFRDMVRPDGRVVLGVPDETSVAAAADRFHVESIHLVRAHRSLTRRFLVLRP